MMSLSLLLVSAAVFFGFLILVLVVVIYHSFDEEKAGTGKVKDGDSTDYSLDKIKK